MQQVDNIENRISTIEQTLSDMARLLLMIKQDIVNQEVRLDKCFGDQTRYLANLISSHASMAAQPVFGNAVGSGVAYTNRFPTVPPPTVSGGGLLDDNFETKEYIKDYFRKLELTKSRNN